MQVLHGGHPHQMYLSKQNTTSHGTMPSEVEVETFPTLAIVIEAAWSSPLRVLRNIREGPSSRLWEGCSETRSEGVGEIEDDARGVARREILTPSNCRLQGSQRNLSATMRRRLP